MQMHGALWHANGLGLLFFLKPSVWVWVYLAVWAVCDRCMCISIWGKRACGTNWTVTQKKRMCVCVWAWQTALLLCLGVNRIISSHTLPPFHRLPEDRWCVCVWVCVFRPWLTWIMYFLISVSVNKTEASFCPMNHMRTRGEALVLVSGLARGEQNYGNISRSLFERLLNALNLQKSTGLSESLGLGITSIEIY